MWCEVGFTPVAREEPSTRQVVVTKCRSSDVRGQTLLNKKAIPNHLCT